MSAGAVTAGPPDAPPVMLIHGLGGSYRVWDRVVPLIEPAARIYAVELESTASIDRDADDAAALIDTPTVLVGHSRGGLVATAIAERHPGLARKLILVCPPWSLTCRLSANRPIERALAVPGIGDLLWALASDARQRTALHSAFAPATPVPDQFVADLRARGRRNLIHSSRAIDDYLKTSPLAGRLNNLTVPTDLVFAEYDARVATPHDEFSHLPHTHLTVLPGIGHTPPWEAPHHVAELIIEQPRGGLPAAAPGARVQAGARRAAAAPAGGLPAGRQRRHGNQRPGDRLGPLQPRLLFLFSLAHAHQGHLLRSVK
jgi:pimeloyl-ACP methyl ester carboxylesterase